jgi:iron transport multicopper oxidase
LNPNVTSWLVYDEKKELPAGKPVDAWNDFDDFTLVPQDKMPKLPKSDITVELTVTMQNLKDGAN